MSLVSHLEEFRKRLVACIICFFAAVLICLGQAAWLTELNISAGIMYTR